MAFKRVPQPITIDFETHPIEDRPRYPPKPVGVSILLPQNKAPVYYAFGHPSDNNCTETMAKNKLAAAYAQAKREGCGLLCHHGKFDLDVAETHWGLQIPAWELCHDTMFLLFLHDPYSPDLKLKPASERILGMKPEESDALRDWAIAQKLIAKNAREYGHLICQMPGELVGKYANGDTLRTDKLFRKLYRSVVQERGMGEAYDRERRLMPVLLRNERQGVAFDLKAGKRDALKYEQAGNDVDTWLLKQLKAGKDFNIDADAQLADALVLCKKADPDLFMLTPTGKRSTAKDSLLAAVTDKNLLSALQYRTRLGTAYGTFLKPWVEEATQTGGLVHPSWNQVRTQGSGGDAGARTGRISASRFMNLPKEFKQRTTGANAYSHPSHIKGLPELPFMRQYLIPFAGETWVKADYLQQEIRVLAHFGDGVLMDRFSEDPLLDVHDLAAKLITEQFGIPVTREGTKTLGFALLYGMGIGALADRLGTDVQNAKTVKNAYLGIFPELKELQNTLKDYAAADMPLTTFGGRQYFVEAPKYIEKRGRVCTFEYKLLNYLVQGSSADCTKEAIIRYDSARQHGRLLVCVHDEIDLSVPRKHIKTEAKLLTDVMSSIEMDVPMLADVGTGPNWGSLEALHF